jgi:hypothetical protein
MNSYNRKIFFWIFGVFLSMIVFLSIEFTNLFINIKQTTGLSLLISLIIIVLFFVIGLISELINYPLKYLLKSKKNLDVGEFSKDIEEYKINSDLKLFSKNLRKTLDYIVKKNYSKEAVDIFRDFVGFDDKVIDDILHHTKKLRKIKIIYWSLGIFLSLLNIFITLKYPLFEFLRITWYVPYAISITIFMLFFIEGMLVIRIPTSFYLNILKAQGQTSKKRKEEINNMKKSLKKVSEKQNKSLDNIVNSISYMLNLNVSENKIIDYLKKEGVKEETSKKLIEKSKQKNKKLSQKEASPLLLKLFLSNIQDEFKSLKEVYSQISTINEKIGTIEEEQKKIKSFVEKEMSREEVKEKISHSQKKNQNIQNKKFVVEPYTEDKKYNEYLEMVYSTIKPYTKIYTKTQIESFLISNNVDLSVIRDLMDLFKKRKVLFSNTKKSMSSQFVFFVNNVYDTFKKKENN